MSAASLRERTPALAAVAVLAIAFTVGACSQGEPEKSKARPNTPSQAPKPVQPTPVAAETSEGLRERLARQEAASKMFDVPEPVKAAKVEAPKPAPARVEPAKPEPAKPEAAKPEPARPEPPKADPPRVDPPGVEPPKVEAKAPPSPPPRTEVAAAKPANPAIVIRRISHVEPEFPREAVQAGAEQGSVRARLTLDVAGNVTQVDVVEAIPRRIFDRAVVRALSQWKYNEGAAGRLVDVEVAFKR
jgi:TonB family protein